MSWDAVATIAEQVRQGKVSATSLVEQSFARANEADEYHALLEMNEHALVRARAIDAGIAKGDNEGRLLGVPFIVKDNFLTHHTKTTAASKFLENFQAPYQASAIEKLEAEGAIMVGKANLDEFAHGSSTENSAYGPTKNPHDPSRVPGGSSGGSAAAVALDIAPFALGTDTGGSIRLPASFCGVVGYKPTYGLVSRFGVIAMASSTDVVGPLTRNVADSGYILDIMAGQDSMDSTTIAREKSYHPEQVDLKGLRVGVIAEHMSDGVDASVRDSIDDAIDKLKQAGAKVSEVHLNLSKLALAAYYVIVPAEISSNLARYDGVKYGKSADTADDLLSTYLQSRGLGFGEEPLRRILAGTFVLSSGYQDAYYKQAQKVRTQISDEYADVFSEVDILIGPTAPTPAFELATKQDPLAMYLSDAMTIATNLAGLPAVSIPARAVGDLPVGLHIQAAQRQDKKLLDIAASIEEIL